MSGNNIEEEGAFTVYKDSYGDEIFVDKTFGRDGELTFESSCNEFFFTRDQLIHLVEQCKEALRSTNDS